MELKFKKTYLKIEEIGNIIEEMSKVKTSTKQELVKIVLVAKYCLDYDFGEMTDLEVYNLVAENNFYDKIDLISNYYDLCRLIKEQFGIERAVSEFLTDLNGKLDTILEKMPKEFDMKSIMGHLKSKK